MSKGAGEQRSRWAEKRSSPAHLHTRTPAHQKGGLLVSKQLYSFQFIKKRYMETWHVVADSEEKARQLLQEQCDVTEFKCVVTSDKVIVEKDDWKFHGLIQMSL